jgi:hypothetical protein
MAIACFLLVTFLPDRPLVSFPCFISCIARFTFFAAVLPYFAIGPPPGLSVHFVIQFGAPRKDCPIDWISL